MTKKLTLVAIFFGIAPLGFAQDKTTTDTGSTDDASLRQDNAAFVFTESQLGENDDVTQNVIMVNSSNNVYTSNVGYLFSPARYKYRAYSSRYNDIYLTTAPSAASTMPRATSMPRESSSRMPSRWPTSVVRRTTTSEPVPCPQGTR